MLNAAWDSVYVSRYEFYAWMPKVRVVTTHSMTLDTLPNLGNLIIYVREHRGKVINAILIT